MTAAEAIAILTQLVTLAGVIGGIIVSLRNRQVVQSGIAKVHELVNGKTDKLEKLIEEKGFAAGKADEKANPS